MRQSLSAVLFPEYRRRVLGLLLLRPDEALHGREVARRTGLPAGTITRELTRLAEVGLLKREKRGNQQVYSADTSGPIYTELASILRKTSGLADVLTEALAPAAESIRSAFVFGSMAEGREVAGSDVDVMLIGDIGFAQAVLLLEPAQRAIGREINPKVYSPHEFADKVRSNVFLATVMSRPKLFLIGTAHALDEWVSRGASDSRIVSESMAPVAARPLPCEPR